MQLTDEDRAKLEKLAKRIGNENAKTLLSVLGREKGFIDAINSPLGEELLKDAIFAVENKLDLILNEKDKPEDRAEVRVYMSILRKWTSRINKYSQNKERLVQALNGR